jgi:hypothetical protein
MNTPIQDPRQLQAAYSYQFAKPLNRWAFRFARGWLAIIVHACEEVDALVRVDKYQHRFHWVQIKEKFGTLRLYWKARGMQGMRIDLITDAGVLSLVPTPEAKGRDGLVATRITQIVRSAEEESARTCMVCGAPGTIRQGGWVLTLCDAHAKQRQGGRKLDAWFEE